MTPSLEAARCVGMAAAFILLAGTELRGADPPRTQNPEATVFTKGVRARILDGRLRDAKLVFDDTAISVELKSGERETYSYESLQLFRGSHHLGVPLLSKSYWLFTLPLVAVNVATGRPSQAAVQPLVGLGVTHGLYFGMRAGSKHWLSFDHRASLHVLAAASQERSSDRDWRGARAQKQETNVCSAAPDPSATESPASPARGR